MGHKPPGRAMPARDISNRFSRSGYTVLLKELSISWFWLISHARADQPIVVASPAEYKPAGFEVNVLGLTTALISQVR
jgi:hypothetical protein